MNRIRIIALTLAALTLAALMLLAFAACSGDDGAGGGNEDGQAVAPIHEGHSDGDRFEVTVTAEGAEEKANMEHLTGKYASYVIDWFCDDFTYSSGEGSDCFTWNYDGDELINYMAISEALEYNRSDLSDLVEQNAAGEFDVIVRADAKIASYDAILLSCTQPSSVIWPDNAVADYYFIDCGASCLMIELHYSTESAEGVGSRMKRMLETLELTNA